MSFFAAFNLHREPVDEDWLRRTQSELSAQSNKVLGSGRVAFVTSQAGLQLSSQDAVQFAALRSCWLIGRIRLDGRDDLCAAFPRISAAEADAVLCLHAYDRWGDQWLEHIRGDFCFVLWDENRQRLLCARDQLGVRPLFYATAGSRVLVSDALDSIAADVTLSSDLDDYWISDFLSSGVCIDPDRTVYRHIKRIPPGHCLMATECGCLVRRYWQLVVDNPIFYQERRQYIEHFREVLTLAIKDRLPADRVGISMSGGIDSSALAAHTLRVAGDSSRVVAHTSHFEHLIPDEEKRFASLVADSLGISLTLRAVDDSWYAADWFALPPKTPEPSAGMVRAVPQRMIAAEMAKQAQVWFYGEGPDNALLFEWQVYLRWLLKTGSWQRLGCAIVQYVAAKRLQDWQLTIRKWMGHRFGSTDNPEVEWPPWLRTEFVEDLDLVTRAREASSVRSPLHPWHPRAVSNLSSSLWPHFLEQFDPAISGTPIIWRHPYLDLRVLTYLLSVPPIPWARRKRLIRKAMRGVLPDEVLRRDKTPLAGDPEAIMLRKWGLPVLLPSGPISRYVDYTKVPVTFPLEPPMHPIINVHVLDCWLRAHQRRDKDAGETRDFIEPEGTSFS